jgi:hypothetical protein
MPDGGVTMSRNRTAKPSPQSSRPPSPLHALQSLQLPTRQSCVAHGGISPGQFLLSYKFGHSAPGWRESTCRSLHWNGVSPPAGGMQGWLHGDHSDQSLTSHMVLPFALSVAGFRGVDGASRPTRSIP